MPIPKFRMVPRRPERAASLALTPLLLLCCGCPLPTTADGDDDSKLPKLDQAGNNTLATASPLGLDGASEVRFTGSIDGVTDIDVYALGDVKPGDRLYIDVQTTGGDLDPVAAVFDSREYLIAFNDDRAADGTNLNPLIDIVLPSNEGNYYLGIIAYPDLPTAGDYEVTVQIVRQAGVHTPEGQLVFLDWDGGEHILVPNVGEYNLKVFSAVDVGLSSSSTAALKQRVEEIVAERYAGYDLTVVSSDDGAEPNTPHSTVYFGGADARAFAISEQVDTFNQDPSDATIVFVQSYQGAFQTEPTLEEMAQALGNTVAHELGHLLGLVHTRDCDDLMDTTCFNDRLLSPQSFKVGQLDFSVFPFGYQPAAEILTWLLGLVPT